MKLITKSKQYNLTERTHIMGILNVTPDSFSDGGHYNSLDKAIQQAQIMEAAGADILDIGGESTRPDHQPVSIDEELSRVIPVIEAIKRHITIPISIDTYKSQVAEAAIVAGAELINDIWGAKHDPLIASVAASYNVPIILMHNRPNKNYEQLIPDMVTDLKASIAIAEEKGVEKHQIILDPGICFAKEPNDNYLVLRQLDGLMQELPYPFLLGASRKSFINKVLDLPATERDNATGATTCFGISKGVHIIRVHDVKRSVELAKMMDAMIKGVGING